MEAIGEPTIVNTTESKLQTLLQFMNVLLVHNNLPPVTNINDFCVVPIL